MITEREQFILTHLRTFGSGGYGAFVTGRGRKWRCEGVNYVFHTRRDAVQQFEAYVNEIYDRRRDSVTA